MSEAGNKAYIDVCPNCGEEIEYEMFYNRHIPDICPNCNMELRGDRTPYCGDCGSKNIDWVGGCWYCFDCNDYPEYVKFRYE